ncbi:mediator of RNA polymerase II transcription subunit 14 [Tanacetum coccineum]
MWRILHLEVLVGETSCPVKLEETRRFVLGDDLERRMVASDTPFTTLYTIFHELYVPLIMDTIIRQVQALRIGIWKDAIRFELISYGNQGQGSLAGSVQTSQDGEADSVVPCSALVLLLAPFLDMGWLMDSYLLIREGFAFEIKIWTTFFDISLSIGADISMIVDLAVWTEPSTLILNCLQMGWTVLWLWFIHMFSALFLRSKVLSHGVYLESFFNETYFVDNLCRDSHVDLMINLVLLLMILEIGHRCDDFEYMVLLEYI